MKKNNKTTPNSKRRKNLSPKNGSTFFSPEFGVTSKCPSVYIRTFGCQMNVRDSEIILGMLLQKGYKRCDSAEAADIVLFNTCSVRKHAEDRAISNMGALLKCKMQNAKCKTKIQNSKIYGIIGCSAQALKKDLFRRLPGLDIVCGTGEIHRLPELIKTAARSKILACSNVDRNIPEISSGYRENEKGAFVSIMRGCNNFCSYCIVPYVRGKERSRQVKDIVREIKELAKRGIREVMMLGQNVNSYREATCDFVKLLRLVSAIKGIEKIRFKTSHPKDVSVRLFRTIRDLDNVAKELHLPLQSGSNRILKLMNRGYTARKYTDLIEKCRQLVPGCEITTDLIVGFPQETEADFRKTFELMNKMKFNAAYIFKYSPRPPAKSAFMKDNVPREIKERRHKMLLDLQKKISKKISAVIIMLLAFSFSAGQVFAQSASLKNAETLILKDAYQEAIKECKKILAHHHQATVRSKTYYLLGISLLKEAEYSQAREKFQAILKQFSRSEFCDDARLGTADSYFLAGDFKQAGKEYERLLQDFPRSELREIAREQQKLCKEGKGASNSYFSVQAGCFTNKTNAEKLRDELIDSGYRAYLLKLPGDNFSRVRIGKFSNRLQAEFLEQQLKSDGYSTKVCP